jgi:hypothetical protein
VSLAGRVARLERARGPAGCPSCGLGGNGPIRFNVPPPKVLLPGWTMGELEEDARVRPEDFCPACGRKVVMRCPSPFLSSGRAR